MSLERELVEKGDEGTGKGMAQEKVRKLGRCRL